ncbi:MAG: O-antigen ligase family protein [Candidatus Coproplasma sp.]
MDNFKRLLSSKYFPFITAVVVVSCYYLSWDMVAIWYLGLCIFAILVFLDDITPLVHVFLFMNIMISWKNSPSQTAGNSDYYFQPAVLAQIGCIIGILIIAIIIKTWISIKKGNFKLTPTFWGLCAFAVAMVLNGIFSSGYNVMNLVYGIFMAFFFLGIFVLGSANIKVNSQTFEKVAWGFIALSICLVLELAIAYATYDGLIVDGEINRYKLMFGWGVYNTMGMLFTISLPSAAYLAIKYKHGWLFTIYLGILVACSFLTMSRQTMLVGSIIAVLCFIAILVKGKYRLAHLGVILICLAICGVFVYLYFDTIKATLSKLADNFLSGSGRTDLWKLGLEYFSTSPFFGVGFFVPVKGDPGFTGLDIIPKMYHNTVIQLLATGGLVALATYSVHRVQTAISYFVNPSLDRTYIVITILALLLLNLLDNHLFYILPTLVYSMLVAVLINSEEFPPMEYKI